MREGLAETLTIARLGVPPTLGMDQTRQQFRRVNGYLHLSALRATLDATAVTAAREDAA